MWGAGASPAFTGRHELGYDLSEGQRTPNDFCVPYAPLSPPDTILTLFFSRESGLFKALCVIRAKNARPIKLNFCGRRRLKKRLRFDPVMSSRYHGFLIHGTNCRTQICELPKYGPSSVVWGGANEEKARRPSFALKRVNVDFRVWAVVSKAF